MRVIQRFFAVLFVSFLRPRLQHIEVQRFFVVLFVSFLRPRLQHMEVPRLGSNQSCSCRPKSQPQQHQILNPLPEARDQMCILTYTMSGS